MHRYMLTAIRPTATATEHATRTVAHQLGLDCRIETYGRLRKTIMVSVSGDDDRMRMFAQWWSVRMMKMGLPR